MVPVRRPVARRRVPALLAAVAGVAALVGWLLLRGGPGVDRDEAQRAEPPGPAAVEGGAAESGRLGPPDARPVDTEQRAAAAGRVEPAAAGEDGRAPRTSVEVTVRLEGASAPEAGCDVRAWVADPETGELASIGRARTDAGGRCELEVPAERRLALEATAPEPSAEGDVGWARRDLRPLADGERRAVELTLPHGTDSDFWGRVVDEDGGAPLGGARIVRRWQRAADLAVAADGVPALATSAADGLFRLRVASWRRGAPLSIELPGYGPAFFRPDADHADRAAPLRLALRRPATLVARVTGADAFGTAGAAVRVTTDAYQLSRPDGVFLGGSDPVWTAPFDADGRTELVLPARIPLRVELLAGGAEPRRLDEPLTLEPGERRDVQWRLGVGALLTGRLVDQHDEPCPRVRLWLSRSALAGDARAGTAHFYSGDHDRVHASARTDADGRFAFEDVPAGTWWVGPSARDLPERPRPRSIAALATGVEILPGETRREVLLRTWRGLVIEGRVLDPWGKPAPGERVAARSELVGGSVSTRTGEAGTFTIGPLAQAEYVLSTGPFSEFAAAEPVSAPAGATGVVLELREAGVLRGVVVDGATGAPAAATVWVSSRETGRRGGASARDEGAFERDGLEPGVYDLAASTGDGRAGVLAGVEVRGGETREGLRVEVLPGARLTLLYEGPTTYGHYTVYCGEVPTAFDGLHTGTSATKVVPAGALHVTLRTQDGREETRELTLAPGAEGEVAFRFE